MLRRLWLVVSIVCVLSVLMVPSIALAEDVSTETAESNEVLALTAAPPTPLSKIQQVWNTPIWIFGAKRYWYTPNALFRMLVLGSDNSNISPVALAVGLVFFWWGVRKTIRMLFRAFRKAKLNG